LAFKKRIRSLAASQSVIPQEAARFIKRLTADGSLKKLTPMADDRDFQLDDKQGVP
jgi:hypothetical protein